MAPAAAHGPTELCALPALAPAGGGGGGGGALRPHWLPTGGEAGPGGEPGR